MLAILLVIVELAVLQGVGLILLKSLEIRPDW